MSNFSTGRAFFDFEKEVQKNRRYIRTPTAEHFLDGVRESCKSKVLRISKGRGFWRAQSGHSWRHLDEIDDDVPAAFPPERMKPLSDRAMEGRANSKGIPALYLCTSKEAAMSEVRPWLGSMLSLARFEVKRELRLVNCSDHQNKRQRFIFEDVPEEEVEEAVRADIDRAFTKPVTRSDDTGEYVATQILTELFRGEGFDGIAYRSAFGEHSLNLALFDLDCAVVNGAQLFEVSSAKFNFRERDNPYWVRSTKRSRTRPLRKEK